MSRFCPLPVALLVLATIAACQVPRAKLHNLREIHTDSGQMSYRGNVQNDLVYALRRASGTGSIRLGSFGTLGDADAPIADPLEVDLENLVALGRMDEADPLTRGIQIEAFGWLAVDDQYVLGRERSVLELGKHLIYLGMGGAVAPPAEPVGPEELSPALADLARAGLGVLPEELDLELAAEAPVALGEAIEALAALPLDREGALRALAVANILFERSEALHTGSAGAELRVLAADLRRQIVGQALYTAARDKSPVVREACATALSRLGADLPGDSLRAFLTDPSAGVSTVALQHLAEHGLPPVDDPLMQGVERDLWIKLLVAHAQYPEGRRSAFACDALGRVTDAGIESLRSEDWAAWWRETYPDEPLPSLGG